MTHASCTVFYTPLFLEHKTTPMHPESPRRLRVCVEELRRSGVCPSDSCAVEAPRRAGEEEVALAHSREYINHVRRVSESGGGFLDGDTPVSAKTYEAAMHAAGAVLEACGRALREGGFKAFCLVRPPGHHAGLDGIALTAPTRGFCVFNNLAIGVKWLLRQGVERILVFDHDCHHGNGTQEILYSDEVLKIDMHQDPRTIYPGSGFVDEIGSGDGEGFMVNIPLPVGSGDDVCRMALDEVARPLIQQFKPQMILISAGFDPHREEPITRLSFTANAFSWMYDLLVEASERFCEGRMIATLEGGYGPFLGNLVTLAVSKMAGVEYEFEEAESKSPSWAVEEFRRTLNRLRDALSPYWDL